MVRAPPPLTLAFETSSLPSSPSPWLPPPPGGLPHPYADGTLAVLPAPVRGQESQAHPTGILTPPEELDNMRQRMGKYVPGMLSSGEKYWRDHSRWLLSRGYQLRPRYDPNWEPSWTKGPRRDDQYIDADKYPDGVSLTYVTAIDATRVRDNTKVYLKRVFRTTHPQEAALSVYLSQGASDQRNHCVPILEAFETPDGDANILVMPFLRKFDDPPFLTVGEAMECIRQLFEGVAFMHEKDIAHRDCTANNIMFNPSDMFPDLYHPIKIHRNQELTGAAKHTTRTAKPPRYYLIDFGLAQYYDRSRGRMPLADPILGGDKTVPEFRRSMGGPYDPFATDVYYIGNVVRTRLLDRYKGLDVVTDLVGRMVKDDPRARPTIHQVETELASIMAGMPLSQFRARLAPANEVAVAGCWRRCKHIVRTVRYVLRGIPPVPGELGRKRRPRRAETAPDLRMPPTTTQSHKDDRNPRRGYSMPSSQIVVGSSTSRNHAQYARAGSADTPPASTLYF